WYSRVVSSNEGCSPAVAPAGFLPRIVLAEDSFPHTYPVLLQIFATTSPTRRFLERITMTTRFLNSILLTAASLSCALTAHAEALHASVPFAFTVNGHKLPAGNYSISEVSGHTGVLLFAESGSGAKTMVFARISSNLAPPSSTPMIFVEQGS